MTSKNRVFASLLACALATTGGAQEALVSTAQDRVDVAVTVYNDGRGMVREERRIELPAGATELRFMDVAEQIEAPTVKVGARDGRPFSVLEQNYEYDLLSPQKLLEKFVGKRVTLVMPRLHEGSTMEDTLSGTLLSTNNGTVWEIDGQIVTNPSYNRLVFPDVPENLIAHPTLVWLVQAQQAGPRRLEATYLTGGMGWRADYVLALDANERDAGLQGWVTIDNRSGAGFENAQLKLVAGDVHRAPQAPQPLAMRAAAKGMIAEEAMVQEPFFEYHLYSLPRRTTLKQNQTKQIQLLDAPRITVKKEYELRSHGGWFRGPWNQGDGKQDVAVMLEFENDEESGLGDPLPKGIVRVYKRDSSGSPQFVGEDRIDHTPKDETVRLQLGNAFDIAAERKQTDYDRISNEVSESAHEIRIRNHKEEAIVVEVIEAIGGDWTMLSSSYPHEKSAAFEARFDVPVEPDGEAVLSYRVRTRY